MTRKEVLLQKTYWAKVAGRLTIVRITHTHSLGKGWTAINCATGRRVHIRSAQKLRRLATERELNNLKTSALHQAALAV